MEQAIGSDSERQIISILKVLSESSEPLGSITIARKLEHEGICLSERGVRYHLMAPQNTSQRLIEAVGQKNHLPIEFWGINIPSFRR